MDFGAPVETVEFRERLRSWLRANLPDEWRDLGEGPVDDARQFEVRTAWGRRLAEAGWAAPTWPEEYGGMGLSADLQLVYLEELSAAGAPPVQNTFTIDIFGPGLIRFGTEDQRRRWLPPMARHEEFWCQGFSEPGAGSDLASLRTRARLDGDRYLVSGQKVWTSFAHHSDFCFILVRTSEGARKHEGITMAVLDMRQPGVTVRPLRNIAGSVEFNEVFLDEAVLPAADVVGEPGQGWEIARYCLAHERGTALFQPGLQLQREVASLARLLDTMPDGPRRGVLRARLAELFATARAIEAACRRNFAIAASGGELGAMASMAKVAWSEARQELLGLAVEAFDEALAVQEPDAEEWTKLLLYSRANTIAGGTSEVNRNIVARSIGLPK